MKRRHTIEDVARLAGVGKVTVSYVINGRTKEARISEETEQRVLAAAASLDYRPSAIARMMSQKRADSIAVVFQYSDHFTASSTFITEAMRGVCEACVEQGLDLMLHTKPVQDAQEEADRLTDGRVDGVLMLRDGDDPALRAILRRSFPCVLFFSRSPDPDVPFVDCDNFAGGRIATQHLLSLGHKDIGMIVGPAGSVASNDRFNGYRDALETAGISPNPDWVVTVPGPSYDAEPLQRMMSAERRPTALFVWSDDVAFMLMQKLAEWGISVPRDVSLVGFDSSDACERVTPPLTSVRQPVSAMARDAARLLAKLARREPVERTGLVYPPTLDIRASSIPFVESAIAL
ncbi:MAG: transcriptional regulator [Chthonomonas sp.]